MEFENQKIKEDMQTKEGTQEIKKKSWTEDVPKWILIPVLICIVLPLLAIAVAPPLLLIIYEPKLQALLIFGFLFLLIMRKWRTAGILLGPFLLLRFFLILFKQ